MRSTLWETSQRRPWPRCWEIWWNTGVWPEGPAGDCAKKASTDPSWNTDQGVYHLCKCEGRKTWTPTEREYKMWDVIVATSAIAESMTMCMSKSIIGRTRKMVNYTWVGWSQEKFWWRLEALLTCKSFVKLACSGERLIEPSSSWFPLKFLSG